MKHFSLLGIVVLVFTACTIDVDVDDNRRPAADSGPTPEDAGASTDADERSDANDFSDADLPNDAGE